uniref:Uncharacterized protein n=1 Tax=Tetraselmis sp. GSL018 TaxID=582737 RepID=A0A061RJL7_9CHLO
MNHILDFVRFCDSSVLPDSEDGSRRLYRWKLKLSTTWSAIKESSIQGYYRLHLPQALGMADEGRWRWRLPAVELDVGAVGELVPGGWT